MTNAEVGAVWRAEAESQLPWQRSTDQAGSGAGILQGYVVTAAGFARRAYLKPGARLLPADRLKCYAAREKVASDLAHDLGLPVPPATLLRVSSAWDDPEPFAVVTLFMHPFQLGWTDVVFDGLRPPNTSEEDMSRVLATASGVLAFDTWLDAFEHGDAHPGNIVWGYNPPDASQLVFLDYASSMGSDGSWAGEGWKRVEVAPFPKHLLERPDRTELERRVEMIRVFPESSVHQVVDRVPGVFLPDTEKTMLKAALVGRREPVAQLLRERFLGRGPRG